MFHLLKISLFYPLNIYIYILLRFFLVVPESNPGLRICSQQLWPLDHIGGHIYINIIAGHLLLTLLGNNGPTIRLSLLGILITAQILRLILESAIAIIQSYHTRCSPFYHGGVLQSTPLPALASEHTICWLHLNVCIRIANKLGNLKKS
jgi:hypothetical protein